MASVVMVTATNPNQEVQIVSETKRKSAPKPATFEPGAEAPGRTYRNIQLKLGLVHIPVGLYTHVESTDSVRHEYVAVTLEDGSTELHEVGRKSIDKVTGEDVTSDQVIKGFRTEDGTVVEITDEELKLHTDAVAEIVTFIDLDKLSADTRRALCPVSFYQARAGMMKVGRESRPNPGAERLLDMMFKIMDENNLTAIVRVSLTKQAPRLALLDTGGQLQILAYQNNVRKERPLARNLEHNEKELGLMRDLILKRHLGRQMPANQDETTNHLLKIVSEKLANDEGRVVKEAVPTTSGVEITSVDLLAALQASLGQATSSS